MATSAERHRSRGEWLFRKRSFLPFLLLPVYLLALRSVELHERHVGESGELVYQLIGLMIAASGLGVRVVVAGSAPRGTSGRNTASHEAASLTTTGIYSIMRHPLYVANYLIVLGCFVFVGSWWLPIVMTALFCPYYLWIIYSEERFLLATFGERYRQWVALTPKFLPNFRTWVSPALPFSLKTAVRREYSSLLLIGVLCGLSEVLGELFFDPSPSYAYGWAILFAFCVLTALALRTIKHHTTWLREPGR